MRATVAVGDGNGREKWLGCGCGPLRLNYRKQGYAVTRRGGANADGGIGLVIEMNGRRWFSAREP
jgi:hypothetical protein